MDVLCKVAILGEDTEGTQHICVASASVAGSRKPLEKHISESTSQSCVTASLAPGDQVLKHTACWPLKLRRCTRAHDADKHIYGVSLSEKLQNSYLAA